MNDKSSDKKDVEDLKNTFIVDGFDKMLTLLDQDYEVAEELSGEKFLMRKLNQRVI